MSDAARLSRLLFSAREQVEMWADVVESQTSKPAHAVRELVAEIDAYRAERGWSPDGFGGEADEGFGKLPEVSTRRTDWGVRDDATGNVGTVGAYNRAATEEWLAELTEPSTLMQRERTTYRDHYTEWVEVITPGVRCDTCGDTGRVPWMSEGDPNMYQEPDAEGMLPCPDCSAGTGGADG